MKLNDFSIEQIKSLKYACAKFIMDYRDEDNNNFAYYDKYLNGKALEIFIKKFNIKDKVESLSDAANYLSERDGIDIKSLDSYLGSLFDSMLNDYFKYKSTDDLSITFEVCDSKVAFNLRLPTPLYISIYDRKDIELDKYSHRIICNFKMTNCNDREFVMFFV